MRTGMIIRTIQPPTVKGLYKFQAFALSPDVTFYIYKDSDLQGAALHFLNMFKHLGEPGNPCDIFHRYNKYCHIGSDAQRYITSYVYIVYPHRESTEIGEEAKPLQLRVRKRVLTNDPNELQYEVVYNGDLSKFVNQHIENTFEYSPLLPIINNQTYASWLNRFYSKIEPSTKSIKIAQQSLTEARRIACLLNMPNSVHQQLQVIENWYKAYFFDENDNPDILKEAVEVIKGLTTPVFISTAT